MRRVALSILRDAAHAQDVTHDVFLRLWSQPDAFDAARGDLGPYLCLMARSRAIDKWRTRQSADRALTRIKHELGRRPDDEPVPTARLDRAEVRGVLGQALRDLPSSQREALTWLFYEGLSVPEIAHRSAIPLGTAKSRVRIGLVRMRAALTQDTRISGLT